MAVKFPAAFSRFAVDTFVRDAPEGYEALDLMEILKTLEG
jgi:hypothetical protein